MPLELGGPLRGEIPAEDFAVNFSILPPHIKKVGLLEFGWLRATVTGQFQWQAPQEFEKHQRALSWFFNEEVQGPFYVMPGTMATRGTLRAVFFDEGDAEVFMGEFEAQPYTFNERSFDENLKILGNRFAKMGWQPQDERLLPYMARAIG